MIHSRSKNYVHMINVQIDGFLADYTGVIQGLSEIRTWHLLQATSSQSCWRSVVVSFPCATKSRFPRSSPKRVLRLGWVLFKRRRFPVEIILRCVRWYCKYGISYRDLVEMMQERGVEVEPSTIMRWVHRYAPEL